MKTVRIGTRASKLAMVQAQMVARAVEAENPALRAELVPMKTTGDKILNQTLDKIGGKGLFVKELDAALLEGRVDITVHSCKDMPMQLNPALPVVAVSAREDARDVLVLPQGADSLDLARPVGCSSARRRVQLGAIIPGVQVQSVRGNVLTRLEKLDGGEYGALVLAAAGLKRLGLESRISRVFEPEEMLPAAGQGILAVQARAGQATEYLAGFNSAAAMRCVLAERAFVRALDGGCSKPCAAYAVLQGEKLVLRGMYVSDDESIVLHGCVTIEGSDVEAEAAGLAERMKADANR